MAESTAEQQSPKNGVADLTGRRGLVRNVLFSWGGQLVFIAAGFIMPRLIDDRLGQEVLGIWDFSWSVVGYFTFVQAGVTSAVNRYVGKHWAEQDIPAINRVLSSATFGLSVAGVLVTLATLAIVLLLPSVSIDQLGSHAQEAQWVVGFLGAGLAVQTALGAYNGVLTGCHRWDLKNINYAAWYVITVVAMIVSLMFGGGLQELAAVTFVVNVFSELSRVRLAYRSCPGLKLRASLVSRSTVLHLYQYGGKTLIPSISALLIGSTSSILIAGYLGPAALALFTRPRSLIRNAETLVRRMTMTLIPTVSSLEATGDVPAMRQLLVRSVSYSLYLVLPIIMMMCVFGGPIMHVWMGPDYADGLLVMILALGSLIPLLQITVEDVLAGLNAHGRAGVAQLIASAVSIGLLVAALGPLQWGLAGAALALTVPSTVMCLIYYPLLVCPRLGIGIGEYYRETCLAPVLHLLPFLLLITGARFAFPNGPLTGLAVACIAGGLLLACIYWTKVLPARLKRWVLGRLCRNSCSSLAP
jgi:O-antigen/teichoic acid export membrane protein